MINVLRSGTARRCRGLHIATSTEIHIGAGLVIHYAVYILYPSHQAKAKKEKLLRPPSPQDSCVMYRWSVMDVQMLNESLSGVEAMLRLEGDA